MAACRFADVPQRRPRSRCTLDYNLSPRLQLGLEYNPLVQELGFRWSWILQAEERGKPQIYANTSSDRIGTPEGRQQVSLNVGMAIPNTTLALYVGLTYSGFEKRLVSPFGMYWRLGKASSVLGMNDGRKTHLLLNYTAPRFYAQAGWIWLRHPSLTLGVAF